MKTLASHIILALIITILYSCSSQRPAHHSITHSYGFYHQEHIYFLLDYKVSQQGRRFWFILPFQLPTKVHFREIYFYRYEPALDNIQKLGVCRKEFKPNISVKSSKFTKDNNKIIFSNYVGYDENKNRQMDIFIWDSKKEEFIDTGYKNPVDENNPLYKKYLSDYISPWSDNPGIIGISRLRREILQHLTVEDYDLPKK